MHQARFVRRHRRVERIDAVVEFAVVLLQMRAVDGERRHLQIAIPADVHLGERFSGAILDFVDANRINPRRMRIDRHLDPHVGDARLRQILEFEERLLVVGRELIVALARAEFVEDVGVVIDEAAASDHGDGRASEDHARQPGEPVGQPAETRRQACLVTAPPQRIGQHGEDQRAAAPVEKEPGAPDPERAFAVHVGQRYLQGRCCHKDTDGSRSRQW